MRNFWKDILKSVMLIIAIYSGATAPTINGWPSIIAAVICGLCAAIFVTTKNDEQ